MTDAPPRFERLLPRGEPVTAEEACVELRPWERAHVDRPLVMCNMVATLDGRITIGGRSGPIGGEGDHALFHALRTVVDAVLAGTGTLRVERYGRMIARPERRAQRAALGLSEDALAVVITRTGVIPWDIPLFDAPEQRVVVIAPPRAVHMPASVRARVEHVPMEAPTPAAALRVLHASHGVRAVLCEGGPTLNRGLLDDGVLDELFVTLGPLVAGGDALRVVEGELDDVVRMRLGWILGHGHEVFLRYCR